MKLVENWKAIALKAWSMWFGYLGVICLWAPEIIYVVAERDTDPRFWFWTALVLLVCSLVGRLCDQGISKTRSPLLVGIFAGLLAVSAPPPAHAQPETPVPDTVFLTEAVPFVAKWEGVRLKAYRDVVGVWTVCFGETKGVKAGDRYSLAECEAMLARELLEYRHGLHGHMTYDTRSNRLPVLRDVAFTSLAYNVGIRAAGRSTAVRRLNAGRVAGACTALTWWNKAGGRVWRGLVNRRNDEYQLCMVGVS